MGIVERKIGSEKLGFGRIDAPGTSAKIEDRVTEFQISLKFADLLPVEVFAKESGTASELRNRTNSDAEFGFEPPRVSLVVQSAQTRKQILIGTRTAPGDQVAVLTFDAQALSLVSFEQWSAMNASERVVQAEYAKTLATISRDGEAALYQGPLGDILVDYMKDHGGFVSREDLASYRTVERSPVRADYRGWEILGPPPPAASGVHIAQMLNILESYDIAAMGFGNAATIHHLAEVLKIAFADRAAASGDPDYVGVPVARLTSKAYADERRRAIDSGRAQQWGAGVAQLEGAHTTHMTAADAMGNVVATTQTINNLFGVKFLIPGLGTVPNNYMNLYDPRPGHALSLAPGKRVTTSMSPVMALRDGKLVYALGLRGGKKIFPSALQALLNLIDHGMSLQEAVEAPRIWTDGNALEVELAVPDAVRAKLTSMDHKVVAVPTVAGA